MNDRHLALISLDYVGLALAPPFVEARLDLVGDGVSTAQVVAVLAGPSPIDHVDD